MHVLCSAILLWVPLLLHAVLRVEPALRARPSPSMPLLFCPPHTAPHRSRSHQSLDCDRLGQHRSPECCHCAATPKRRPAHATRQCRPACLTQRILRTSQVAPTQSMLLPHSPTAVSLPTCIHPAELHSHSQAAFTSPMQPNQLHPHAPVRPPRCSIPDACVHAPSPLVRSSTQLQ